MRPSYIHKVGDVEINVPELVEVTIHGYDIMAKLKPDVQKLVAEAVDKVEKTVKEQLSQYNINVDFKRV